MTTPQDHTQMTYDVTNLNYEDFLNTVTDDELLTICNLSEYMDEPTRYDVLDFGRMPAYLYFILLREMLLVDKVSPRAKSIRMVLKLGHDTDDEITEELFYESRAGLRYDISLIKHASFYKQMEYLIQSETVEDMVEDAVREVSLTHNQYIGAFYLGFISQLEPDEYTVVNDIYTVVDLEVSINRLVDDIHFNMCLMDIYSILFMKEYYESTYDMSPVDRIIQSPIQNIPQYPSVKKCYFNYDETVSRRKSLKWM